MKNNVLDDLLTRLSARLPELEWKLSQLNNNVINPTLLPRGLFRSRLELTSSACVDEIKADLLMMKHQESTTGAHYLAEQVSRKINVLVRMCQQSEIKKTPERQINFGVKAIGTRQQWLQTLQNDIDTLSKQQQALTASMENLKAENNIPAILSLKAEIGRAEHRLTVAKETLARSTSF